ncbi:hypothetical protein AWW66_19505 [Micromonospora rosaria]|uniref:Uncharacterized protein n=1 Tax=Micromonospora rosaria TaxID=47874 RepID=A0A136PPM2_9ACTN|nr:hypothetical protein [Micromonospora rosaria]KXK60308.1 hypothetical protein AWW66_19505 [Micromonospora rosaria]
MAAARERGGVPPIDREEVRFRVWVAVVSGVLAAIALTWVGPRLSAESEAYCAYRAGRLVQKPATVFEITSSGGGTEGYYSGSGATQEIRYLPSSGGERASSTGNGYAYVEVREGQAVRLGLWDEKIISVDGRYVRDPWTPGVLALSTLLPPAFVLMVLQIHRLWRLRTDRPKHLFGRTRSRGYALAALLLAFVTGLVAAVIGGALWLPAQALAASALGPLAWYALRETIDRRADRRGQHRPT